MIAFHASQNKEIGKGSELTPNPVYEQKWGHNDFYEALERHRPNNQRPHKDSVFVAPTAEDADLGAGGGERMTLVAVKGEIIWHDVNWSSEISCLISDGYSIDSDEVTQAAAKYWAGASYYRESVWEGTCNQAIVVEVFDYEEDEDLMERAKSRIEEKMEKSTNPSELSP